MQLKQSLIKLLVLLELGVFLTPGAVTAQIIPDRTLGGENSRVIRNRMTRGIRSDLINGGARRGSALFHSLREFNVPRGRGTYFVIPDGVRDIFTRITGKNPSRIFGTLGVIKNPSLGTLGNANLFLINPNGLIFYKDARLDMNGSFLGTTASSRGI